MPREAVMRWAVLSVIAISIGALTIKAAIDRGAAEPTTTRPDVRSLEEQCLRQDLLEMDDRQAGRGGTPGARCAEIVGCEFRGTGCEGAARSGYGCDPYMACLPKVVARKPADPSLELRGAERIAFCTQQAVASCGDHAGCRIETGCGGRRPCDDKGEVDGDCDPTHPGTCDPDPSCTARSIEDEPR